ncbi:MAG: GtrA family protein [Patescibacteria group bacterium]
MKKNFFKFFIVGVSSLILDMLLLIFLKENLGFSAVSAVALNQIIVVVYNFILNKYWSFETKKMLLQQFIRYLILVLINYFFSIMSMYFFSGVIGINYQLVRLLTIACLFIFNFVFYKNWVYREN